VDTITADANTSVLNVDRSLGQMCVAGQVQEFDRTATPFNRSVTLTYRSIATIRKATDNTVKADSVSVSLTLEIMNLVPAVSGGPFLEYDQTITAECKLKARLQKKGSRDRVRLRCDLGRNLSDFPDLTPELIQNVANASLKRVKIHMERGRLNLWTHGVPTDAGVPVSCEFPTPE
jgi:hypothetical protein